MKRDWARAVKHLPGIVEEYAYPKDGAVVRTLLVYKEDNKNSPNCGKWVVYFGWIANFERVDDKNGKYWAFKTKWMAKRYTKKIVKLYPRYELESYRSPLVLLIIHQICRTCLDGLYKLSVDGIEQLVQVRRRLFLRLNKKLINDIQDKESNEYDGYK